MNLTLHRSYDFPDTRQLVYKLGEQEIAQATYWSPVHESCQKEEIEPGWHWCLFLPDYLDSDDVFADHLQCERAIMAKLEEIVKEKVTISTTVGKQS